MSEVYAFWMDEKVDKCGSEKNLRNAVIAGQRFSQVALGAPAEVATFASPSEPRIQPLQCPKQNDILVLHELLWYRRQEMSMPSDRQQMVHETVYELQYIAQAAFTEWGVRCFGSIENGFSTYESDLDVTIVQPGVMQVESQYVVEILQQYVVPLLLTSKSGRFEIIGTVAEARIPIIKLKYWRSEFEVLDVDLSCYNTEPFLNTQLLFAYSQMGEGIVAALGVLVKLWAKSAGVSGASQKHLSSYSIILMVLYFLQVVHKLPCLPASAFDGSLEIPPQGRQQWLWEGSMTMLLWEFFKFYAMDFQWGTEVVAIHLGQRTHTSDLQHQHLKGRRTARLHIEDPFLPKKNLNAPLGLEQERQLKNAFWEAAVSLQNGQLPAGLTPAAVVRDSTLAAHVPPCMSSAWCLRYNVPTVGEESRQTEKDCELGDGERRALHREASTAAVKHCRNHDKVVRQCMRRASRSQLRGCRTGSSLGLELPPTRQKKCELEDVESRVWHREACIATVKRSIDYEAVAEYSARPTTPDPRQADVSKRVWQKSVQQWRIRLKALTPGDRVIPDAVSPDGFRHTSNTSSVCIHLPLSADSVTYSLAPEEPLRVPRPSDRQRPSNRSRRGVNEECEEETWQTRSAHRVAGVKAVKRSADYIRVTANSLTPRPRTPDPIDRKLSKRAWERSVQQWRIDLRAISDNMSTASDVVIAIVNGRDP